MASNPKPTPLPLLLLLTTLLAAGVHGAEAQLQPGQRLPGASCGPGYYFCASCAPSGTGCADCIMGFALERSEGEQGGLCLPPDTPNGDWWSASAEQGRLDLILARADMEADSQTKAAQLRALAEELRALAARQTPGGATHTPALEKAVAQSLHLAQQLQELRHKIAEADHDLISMRATAALAGQQLNSMRSSASAASAPVAAGSEQASEGTPSRSLQQQFRLDPQEALKVAGLAHTLVEGVEEKDPGAWIKTVEEAADAEAAEARAQFASGASRELKSVEPQAQVQVQGGAMAAATAAAGSGSKGPGLRGINKLLR
mmetsp:Transcript_4196/g.10485  ORF Transcript_4196/g.10485 Transcript_4196/m.10485 type:complete len:317 (-) Transcript_4196:427-1377(-)